MFHYNMNKKLKSQFILNKFKIKLNYSVLIGWKVTKDLMKENYVTRKICKQPIISTEYTISLQLIVVLILN